MYVWTMPGTRFSFTRQVFIQVIMREVITKLYKFEELSEEAKLKCIEVVQNDEDYLFYDWWDSCYEWFKDTYGHLFDIDRIYFSGFWSQGDGAMFEYSFLYENEWLDLFLAEQKDMSETRKAMMKKFAAISGKGSHRGHYYHEKSCHHDVHIEANVDGICKMSSRSSSRITMKIFAVSYTIH